MHARLIGQVKRGKPVHLDSAGSGPSTPSRAVVVGKREPDGVSQARPTPPGVSWSLKGSEEVGDLASATTGEKTGKGAVQKASLGQFIEAGGLRFGQGLQLSNVSGDHSRFTSFRLVRGVDGDLEECERASWQNPSTAP